MLKNFIVFDFGKSYFRDTSVMQLIKEKLPVSMSLGIWMTLADLSDFNPARHPQGGLGRLALRRLDLRHHHHRLRHPGLPDRDLPHHPVRRGSYWDVFPLRGLTSDQLGGPVLVAEESSITFGI